MRLKTFLILATLNLSACAHLKPFPAHNAFDIDLDHNVCGEYQVDHKSIKFTWIKDHPLAYCNGLLGVRAADFARDLAWAREAKVVMERQCK